MTAQQQLIAGMGNAATAPMTVDVHDSIRMSLALPAQKAGMEDVDRPCIAWPTLMTSCRRRAMKDVRVALSCFLAGLPPSIACKEVQS